MRRVCTSTSQPISRKLVVGEVSLHHSIVMRLQSRKFHLHQGGHWVVVRKVDASGHVAEECEVGLNEPLLTYVASLKSSMEIYQSRLIAHKCWCPFCCSTPL
jgi:hypothetical protein